MWTPTSTSSTNETTIDELFLEVGRVARAHGLSGEVVVVLVSNRPERLEPGSVLRAAGRDLRVCSSRPFSGRFLVRFEGVEDRRSADELAGQSLLARPLEDPHALWVHELVGARVRSLDGKEIGKVAAVLANPASDLLELEDGGLVPARFVVRHSPGEVLVDIPPGLLE